MIFHFFISIKFNDIELLILFIDNNLLVMECSIRNIGLIYQLITLPQKMWDAVSMTALKLYSDIRSPLARNFNQQEKRQRIRFGINPATWNRPGTSRESNAM